MVFMKNDMIELGVSINVCLFVWISIWYWFVYGSLLICGGGDWEGVCLLYDKDLGVIDFWYLL